VPEGLPGQMIVIAHVMVCVPVGVYYLLTELYTITFESRTGLTLTAAGYWVH